MTSLVYLKKLHNIQKIVFKFISWKPGFFYNCFTSLWNPGENFFDKIYKTKLIEKLAGSGKSPKTANFLILVFLIFSIFIMN